LKKDTTKKASISNRDPTPLVDKKTRDQVMQEVPIDSIQLA
jgi:hypothetical protein